MQDHRFHPQSVGNDPQDELRSDLQESQLERNLNLGGRWPWPRIHIPSRRIVRVPNPERTGVIHSCLDELDHCGITGS